MMTWRTFKIHIPNWAQRMNIFHNQLRPLLVELQASRLIAGYNYNFYGPTDAHIALRLQPTSKDSLARLRAKLGEGGMSVTEHNYDEPETVKKAYELGSRWAFLFWELVEEGRLKPEQIREVNLRRLVLHGLFNSMGFGYDDEALLYCVGLCGLAAQGAIGDPKIKKVAEILLKACEESGLVQWRA